VRPAGRGPVRWAAEIALGGYRSVLLGALTGLLPAVGVTVGVGGWRFASSWSDRLTAPLPVRVLAACGEALMTAVWVAAALWIVGVLLARPIAQTCRRLAGRWLGLRLAVEYPPPVPVVQMATGYWWDGTEYHSSEREARRRAAMNARFHTPQLRYDGLWLAAAAVTVLPAVAVPLTTLGAGAYLLSRPGLPVAGAALVVLGVLLAPFGWRVFGPVAAALLGRTPRDRRDERVERLEAIRTDLTRTQAAELERIERGLHDGPQARLVALGMSMGAAERLIESDPAAARAILSEARAASATALSELRSLVRGIDPPVLVERGLVDAVRALALDAPLSVEVRAALPGRPERPIEAAVYFAIAELLANAAKHAHAAHVDVDLGYADGTLTGTVADDGTGGAAPSPGSGLAGIERRLAAFDGRLDIDSPSGGPTRITLAVPCVLS